MTQTEILTLNFEEIRRRSIKLWDGLMPENYYWRPDTGAMTCIEMIRHVLEGEHLFHKIVDNRGNLGEYASPWAGRPYTNVQAELDFAKPYREKFLQAISAFSPDDLDSIEIIRTEKNQRRKLGDYLQRIAYHEAVHTGQLLGYFRTLRIDIPLIWD
jgi:uncharacterized damage-inducible protein DinB